MRRLESEHGGALPPQRGIVEPVDVDGVFQFENRHCVIYSMATRGLSLKEL